MKKYNSNNFLGRIAIHRNIKSFSGIGRKYNVSDKAVAKWFKMFGLPHKKQELANYINNFN